MLRAAQGGSRINDQDPDTGNPCADHDWNCLTWFATRLDDAPWWRFAARGVRIGAATLPQSARIIGSYRNAVWVDLWDADDVPSRARYRVGYASGTGEH